MTVSAQNSYIEYTGNGSTAAYSWPYKLLAAADLKVYTVVIATGVETLQTSGGSGTYDYNINGALNTVTLNNNLPATHKLYLTRVMSLAQTTDYIEGDAFPAATHEETLDNIVLQLQQHEEQLKRALKFKQSTATRSEPDIPELAANTLIKVNSSGNGFETQSTTNVDTVAGIASDITTVAGISSNVTSVAGNASNINAVAADATDIGAVAAKATEIGRLGTADAVADMALLGNSDVIADMALLGNADVIADMALLADADVISDLNTLATSDIVSDLNTLATSDIVSDINTLATSDIVSDLNTLATSDIVSDINTLATSDIVSDLNTLATSDFVSDLNLVATSANVTAINNVSGSIANVNTVATNLSGVNSFADRYRVGSADPTSDLDAGDLAYNTSANALKYYNGSAWVAIVAGGITDIVQDGTPQLGGNLDLNGNDIPPSPSVKGFSIAMAIVFG